MNELVSPVIGLSTALGAKYMSGFGNTFETEALARRASRRAQLAAEGELRAVCRAAFRFAVHRAAGDQPALLALFASARRLRHTGRFERHDDGLIRTAPQRESALPIGPLRWGPTPIPGEKAHLRPPACAP